jgi:hypothetical protein
MANFNFTLKRGVSGEDTLFPQTTWTQVLNKPTTFTPTAHTHAIADVTGLQTTLDGKAETSHTHTIANVTGLQTALDNKAATSHTHGNIQNNGTITATAVAIESGDTILIANNNNSQLIERGIAFGTATTTFLRNDGQWVTPAGGGNIIGPTTSVVDSVPQWNNTTGTLLKAGLGISDSQSPGALGTTQTLVTERDVYYGTPTINNSKSYTVSTNIYAPSTGGTAGQFLVSSGTTSQPVWESSRYYARRNTPTGVNTTTAIEIVAINSLPAGTYYFQFNGTATLYNTGVSVSRAYQVIFSADSTTGYSSIQGDVLFSPSSSRVDNTGISSFNLAPIRTVNSALVSPLSGSYVQSDTLSVITSAPVYASGVFVITSTRNFRVHIRQNTSNTNSYVQADTGSTLSIIKIA